MKSKSVTETKDLCFSLQSSLINIFEFKEYFILLLSLSRRIPLSKIHFRFNVMEILPVNFIYRGYELILITT